MWKSFPEFNLSPEQWVEELNNQRIGAFSTYNIHRALRRAVRDKVITREEQKNLRNMIKASDEDCYTALLALESKYKLQKTKNE